MLIKHVVTSLRCRVRTCLGRMNFCLRHMILFVVGLVVGIALYQFGVLYDQVKIHIKLNITSINGTDLGPFYRDDLIPVDVTTGYVVPNIVHYIWFGEDHVMSFVNYVSVLSAYRNQRPDVIMFHCDNLPVGEWWERLWKEVPIEITYRDPPSEVFGQKLLHVYHKGDVAKLEILQEYGGIYLDYDVIVIQSLNALRRYEITMGQEQTRKLNAGIILANKDSLFLKLWYNSYKGNYKPIDWDYNCAKVTYELYRRRPELIHVEKTKLTTPDWRQRSLLWNDVIDWRRLYVLHVMMHFDWKVYTPQNVGSMNNTFGEVVRQIYYNSSKLIQN